jgi:hypothetical protein
MDVSGKAQSFNKEAFVYLNITAVIKCIQDAVHLSDRVIRGLPQQTMLQPLKCYKFDSTLPPKQAEIHSAGT